MDISQLRRDAIIARSAISNFRQKLDRANRALTKHEQTKLIHALAAEHEQIIEAQAKKIV
jgi:5-formyltetrahydrofolate cyclo-ligase